MADTLLARPDITLTIDSEGVIREAVSTAELAAEGLDRWRGRTWKETVSPEISAQVAQVIERARASGDSACFQINQRFPSGRELLIEYTTISLGKKAGFVAVGKNLQAISDLQSRLAVAQEAREQDYWKLREIETRYRALLDASSDAVALVRVTNLRVVEANVAAAKTLGLVPGAEFFPDLPQRDRKGLEAMLESVRAHGRAPGIVLHLAASQWSLRASMIATEAGSFYLFQLTPLSGGAESREASPAFAIEDIALRLPDGFVVADRTGEVKWVNHTFLDLVQIGVESAVIGQNLKRWLSRPGADLSVILDLVQRHGSVRMLATRLDGELGSSTDVEISAVGDRLGSADYIGLVLRDVTTRNMMMATVTADDAAPSGAADPSPDASLETLVQAAIEAVERKSISAALARARGNRTVASRFLGLSRQSLHAKLKKYKVAPNL